MVDVYLGDIAARQYDDVLGVATLRDLADAIDEVLSALASNPGEARLRRHAFRQLLEHGLAYGVDLRGSGESWILLWTWKPDSDGDVLVLYLGPPPGASG